MNYFAAAAVSAAAAAAPAAGNVLDVGVKVVNLANGLRNLQKSKDDASSGSGSGAPRNVVEDQQGEADGGNSASQNEAQVEQDEPDIWHDASEDPDGVEQVGADVSHPCSDASTGAPLGVSKCLDAPTCVLALFPKGANAAVCAGVEALPVDIIKGFDALVRALKDKATIQDDPDIKTRLGPVQDACDRILKGIEEADESDDKRFPDRAQTDVTKAKDSAKDLYLWVWRHVPNKPDSSETMTKQVKIQVVPYIMALAYATRIRVISQLVKRDMTDLESHREKYLNKACKIVDDFTAVAQPALERLMASTTLAEVALDYELPIALYLTVMTRLRASVDAIKSPGAGPKDMPAFDDGLSSIRAALRWEPGGSGDQTRGKTIELKNLDESLWWARFTDTDFTAIRCTNLRTSFEIRELTHVLGAGSHDLAHTLALKPGQESALLQLPPASALRSTLCANIAHALQAIHAARPLPPTFARTTSAHSPPDHTMRSVHAAPARLHVAASRTLTGHTHWVAAVAVCPDGERVVSGSLDCTARLWRLSGGQPLRSLSGHKESIWCVAVSPDGKRAVSGSDDKSVRVWSVDSGGAQRTLKGHTGWVRAVAVSPDGRSIASGSDDKTVRLWNADTGQCRATLPGHSNTVCCVAFSPDGGTLVSGSKDKSIRVWNARTGALERTLYGHSDAVQGVAVTPDGQWLVSGSWDRTVRVWSLSSGAEEMAFTKHSGGVTCVAAFPDGQRIASGSSDKSVRVWNLRSRVLELTLTGHSEFVRSVAVSPDGRSVVSGSFDKTIKVWDVSGSG